jgi:hypothetical protein
VNQPDEIHTAVRQNVQTAVLTATEVAIAVTEHLTHRARLAQERAQSEARELQQRLRGEYAAAKPLLHRPWSEVWWHKAGAEQIGASWQAAASWAAAGDPYAHQTLQTMRRELAQRFQLAEPAPGLPPEELVAALKAALGEEADADRLRLRARDLRTQAEQAEESAEQLDADSDREQARAARYEAGEYRAQAQQDLQIAAAWEAMADRQAVAAADVAAEGFPGRPSQRVAASRAAAQAQPKAIQQKVTQQQPLPARTVAGRSAVPERE